MISVLGDAMAINPFTGSQRQLLFPAEVAAFQKSGTLIMDDRRRRPLWFDGRFLAGRDLEREQNYFLTRISDLRRAAGFGVMSGLNVSQVITPRSGRGIDTINIGQGEGVTPQGELVSIPFDIEISLADIGGEQHLNAAFGLSRIPARPANTRSGLFVLGLRPVEFSTNPIASYPTTVNGTRSTQDGDTAEASAIVLIQYSDSGTQNELDIRRSRVAREIFVTQTSRSAAADVLPLAMIGMNQGFIQWIDPWMVRREIGSDQLLLTLNSSVRATRRSYLLQYENQLQEIVTQRGAQGASFAASDFFSALPPIGRMPAAAIDPTQFSQKFFPQDMDVVLSLVPQDELPALIEQSLSLPPIDLLAPTSTLAAISVFVLVSVSRADYAKNHATLGSRPLPPSVPIDPVRRLPIDALLLNRAMLTSGSSLLTRIGSRIILPPITPPQSTAGGSDAAWASLLANQSFLWFVRRRSVPQAVSIGS
jgi:hypothetical protein